MGGGEFGKLVRECAPDSFMTSEGLLERSAELFRTTKPLLHYINRGIEYALEELGREEFVL